MGDYFVDVDGEIVASDLTYVAAHRLAWRSMHGPVDCVDVCHVGNVYEPVVAWVRHGGRWRRERGGRS